MPRPLPAEPKVRVNITLPPKLHQEITLRADDSLRSFSAELTLLLLSGLERERQHLLTECRAGAALWREENPDDAEEINELP